MHMSFSLTNTPMAAMLSIKVTDTIKFAYHDSGPPPNKTVYDTVVLIHGHTYHTGTFKPMLDQAHDFGFRIILPNRRLYPGSTPYTKEEVDALQADKSVDDRTQAFLKQGEYLLKFVNNVIAEHKLQSVLLVGWSLGTAFLNATVASITTVGEDLRANLRKTVKSIVWWDTPASAHGLPNPPTGGWVPLYDLSLTPEERGPAFAHWLAQYYPHKDLDKKDCHGLIYKITTPIKRPTFTGVSFDELLTKVDLTAGVNGDDPIGDIPFQPIVDIVRKLAVFNKPVRDEWGNVPFIVLYGDESPYNVQWAVWKFEEEAEKTGLPIRTIPMSGANHFAMEDHTKLTFETLRTCI
ncbi:hypothetical protein D9619_008564 [Psilocybe cf. subviscida]|uniref:AB hydrolase-1 domain-containing protein n=1 Tax=Psilocybe cf. subviscida TaxID=2480587 RepID=A0A8H5BA77_9AGAR|nr:hypothetical protein D9619_008564 [Psilocybe cf. subviscida]